MGRNKLTKNEIWKNVSWIDTTLPDKYSVSSKGRVRNNYTNNIINPYFHKSTKSSNGVYFVSMSYNNGNKTRSVCRLVAQAFIDTHNIDTKGLTAYNKDGNPANNNADNVGWFIGGPNSTDSKIDVDNIELINSIIIENNHLSCRIICEKISDKLHMKISTKTIQKYRSIITEDFKKIKEQTKPKRFWYSDTMIDKCIRNSHKHTKSIIRINLCDTSVTKYPSIKVATKECEISNKAFYKHIKSKPGYEHLIDKNTCGEYILRYE